MFSSQLAPRKRILQRDRPSHDHSKFGLAVAVCAAVQSVQGPCFTDQAAVLYSLSPEFTLFKLHRFRCIASTALRPSQSSSKPLDCGGHCSLLQAISLPSVGSTTPTSLLCLLQLLLLQQVAPAEMRHRPARSQSREKCVFVGFASSPSTSLPTSSHIFSHNTSYQHPPSPHSYTLSPSPPPPKKFALSSTRSTRSALSRAWHLELATSSRTKHGTRDGGQEPTTARVSVEFLQRLSCNG